MKTSNEVARDVLNKAIARIDESIEQLKPLILEEWYKADGTLMIDDNGKRVWIDRTPASDKNVKAINQVIPRFLEIFPNAKRTTVAHPKFGTKRRIPALKGISLPMGSQEQQNRV